MCFVRDQLDINYNKPIIMMRNCVENIRFVEKHYILVVKSPFVVLSSNPATHWYIVVVDDVFAVF